MHSIGNLRGRILAGTLIVLMLGLICGGIFLYRSNRGSDGEIEYLIGVSQANMQEPWRLVLTEELMEEAQKHENVRLVMQDAASDTAKQKQDVEKLLSYGIDLLIISLHDVEEMTPFIAEVYEQIPVIIMDKAVEGFDYTLFIGPDNELIGRQAAEAVLLRLPKQRGKVLELGGDSESQASILKSAGFKNLLATYPFIRHEYMTVPSGSRDEAEDLLLEQADLLAGTDVIFAHNDFMALGACKAIERLGLDIEIIGSDGFTGENNGLHLVEQGAIQGTIACSTGGREAIQYALDILNEVSGVPKQVILRSDEVTEENLAVYQEELNQVYQEPEESIEVGYSQVGTESAWRLANTESIQQAAKDEGILLWFEDADQSQEKQLEAIRGFIEKQVDVIVVSPVVETGWDEVLEEAKAAGIPVLLSDRKIEVDDPTLYMTYIGADFIEEGKRAFRWIEENLPAGQESVRIMEIEGSVGASPTMERHKGFTDVMNEASGYEIVYSGCGDYTVEGGAEVIRDYLKDHDWDIDVIFAHNDDMALGAIAILEERGLDPGGRTRVVSVDGTKEAFEAMIEGKLNFAVECNPLLGPQLMKAVKDMAAGKKLPLRIITEEKTYDAVQAKEVIKQRKY